MEFVKTDGGRSKYFKGNAGDCVTRAIAIAFDLDYKEVYNLLSDEQKTFLQNTRSKKYNKSKSSTARDGVYKPVYKELLDDWAEWTALMKIGSGCTTHVNADELPTTGTYILRLSKHLTVWKNGKLYDTYDCSRNGTRCVYGYWKIPT